MSGISTEKMSRFFPSAPVIVFAFPCITWALCRCARGDPLLPSFFADKATLHNLSDTWTLAPSLACTFYIWVPLPVPYGELRHLLQQSHSGLCTLLLQEELLPFFFGVLWIGFFWVLLVFWFFSYSKVTLQVPTALQLTKCSVSV